MLSSKTLLFCVFCFSTIKLSIQAITVFNVNECNEPVEGKGSISYIFKNDPKGIDGTIHIPEDITDENTFHLKVVQKVDGNWEDKNEQTANLCENLDLWLQDVHKKFKTEVKPSLPEDDCFMGTGDYELKNFQLSDSDVTVPLGMEGEYKIEITPHTTSGDPMFCFQVHLDIPTSV